MIEQIQLRNFQSHRKFDLALDPHVTTILGESDIGKTAILRALYYLTFNVPPDQKFTTHGAEFTRVSALVDDRWITRYKGPKGNLYYLDEDVFTGVGKSVPDTIANLLNLRESNFAMQLDPHYWFNDTSGQVSRQLNEIFNLESIDITLTNIGNTLKKAKATEEVIFDRLEQAKAQCEELKWVVVFDSDLQGLEQQQARIIARDKDIAQLHSDLAIAQEYKNTQRVAAEAHAGGLAVLEIAGRAMARQAVIDELSDLITEAANLSGILAREIPDLNPISKLREQIKKRSKEIKDLEETIAEASRLKEEICQRDAELLHLRTTLAKSKTIVCQLCGQVIPSSPSSRPTFTCH